MSRKSKNKKKNWRLHCDIRDVEDAVDERRREQVYGVLATDKKNEELFTIGSAPENLDKPKFLRSEYHCSNHSSITLPGHSAIKNEDHGDSSDDEADVPKESMYTYRNHSIANNVLCRGLNSLRDSLREAKPLDIWACDSNKPREELHKFSGRFKNLNYVRHNLEIPHSGASYNPSFADHQSLLRKAINDEREHLKKLRKVNCKLKMSSMDKDDREKEWLEEFTEGLADLSEKDDQDTYDNEPIVNRPFVHVGTSRKTAKQRRKEKLQKKSIQLQKAMKLNKIRMSEVYRMKSLKKEILAKEKLSKERMLKRLKQKMMRNTKRIGKYRYEKLPVEVQLSSELCPSLRLLQASGNCLSDRFKDFEKRNMIEPKGPPLKARYRKFPRVKWVESRSYSLRTDS